MIGKTGPGSKRALCLGLWLTEKQKGFKREFGPDPNTDLSGLWAWGQMSLEICKPKRATGPGLGSKSK